MGAEGAATEKLNELRAMNLNISIDDFGTGYSSMGYLKRLPISTLKIDRSFIKDTPGDSDNVAITSAIIAMAKILKLDIVAEGVETQEQIDFLLSQGCTIIQGYFISPLCLHRHLAKCCKHKPLLNQWKISFQIPPFRYLTAH